MNFKRIKTLEVKDKSLIELDDVLWRISDYDYVKGKLFKNPLGVGKTLWVSGDRIITGSVNIVYKNNINTIFLKPYEHIISKFSNYPTYNIHNYKHNFDENIKLIGNFYTNYYDLFNYKSKKRIDRMILDFIKRYENLTGLTNLREMIRLTSFRISM